MKTTIKIYYENLRAASDICDVLEEFMSGIITETTPTKLLCNCPNHASASGKSLHIDAEKQLWYCWGCKRGGDVIDLVEFLTAGNMSLRAKGPQTNSHRKARDYLAKRANLPVLGHSELDPEQEEALQKQRAKDARTFECLTWISDYYHMKLEKNQEILEWLSDHYAISSKTISALKIGYSDNEGILENLDSSQFPTDEILSTGTFIESALGLLPLFRNRITFPYWSKGKGVVYMIGRKTPWTPDDKYESGKYKKLLLHSQKYPYIGECINNSTLYNEDCLIRSPETIVITEGVTDVIAAMEREFSAISPVTVRVKRADLDRICEKIHGYSGRIIIVQDNELSQVGLKGALDNARELCTRGFDARIAELPLEKRHIKARKILQDKYGLDLNKSPEELSIQITKFTEKEEKEEIENLKNQSKTDINEYFKEGHSREEFQKILDESLTPLEFSIANLDPNCKVLDIQNHLNEIISEISTLNPVNKKYYLEQINKRRPDITSEAMKEMMGNELKKGKESSKHENPINQLLSLFYDSGSTAFTDQLGNGWITTRVNNHYENINIQSPKFEGIMLNKYHKTYDNDVSLEKIKNLGILLTERSTESRYLFNRFAWLGDRLLIDLSDPDWKVIEVTEAGWDIIQPEKPVFRRFRHQHPMPIPKRGGDIRKVFDYLSVKDEGNRALLLVWLCTCMLEHIPRAAIILHGIQGSCKTSGADFIRLLVDPCSNLHSSLSKDHTEFIQLIDHHAVVSLDNISSLPQWASDDLCTAITGGGHSKRSLYTNDDDFPYSFRRVFILNGISIPTTAPDLLDRSLLIELTRLEKKDRKTITKLKKSFEADSPNILGQILDVLVYVISRRHEDLEEYSRLADWLGSACIAAEKLGVKKEFLKALDKIEAEQHVEIIESHLECQILMEFMEGKDVWDGTKGELYNQLTEIVNDRGDKRYWTKTVSAFSKKLKRYYHNFKEMGVQLTDYKDKNTRMIRIEKIKPSEPCHNEGDVLTELPESSGFAVPAVPAINDNHIIGLRSTPTGLYLVRGTVQDVNDDDKKLQSSPPIYEPYNPVDTREVKKWNKSQKEAYRFHFACNLNSGMGRTEARIAAFKFVKNSPGFSSMPKDGYGS